MTIIDLFRTCGTAGAILALAVTGCVPNNNNGDGDDDNNTGLLGGGTSIAVIVNPTPNTGSTTTVLPGPERAGIAVEIAGAVPPNAATTNGEGFAVLSGLTPGENVLVFSEGSIAVDVPAAGDHVDVVVAVAAGRVEFMTPPIHYPIGGADVIVATTPEALAAAVGQDGSVVVLPPDTLAGPLEVRGEGILLFGSIGLGAGDRSRIDGDVRWLGGSGRLRGVDVDGAIVANANAFSALGCSFDGADVTGNGVSLIVNDFTAAATVPSSNATLVGNTGIP